MTSSSTWSDESHSFLTGDNALYVAHLYSSYLQDPESVDMPWRAYFSSLNDTQTSVFKELQGPTWVSESQKTQEVPQSAGGKEAILDSIRATLLIRAYREWGHSLAQLDPLGLTPPRAHPELDPKTYGFQESDYDRPLLIEEDSTPIYTTLRKILGRMQQIYCGSSGFEFYQIQKPERVQWLQDHIEKNSELSQDRSWKKKVLQELIKAENFEQFLHKKYPAAKRFGLDGAESAIPGLLEALKISAELGVEEVVIGMAHRGRLNVLANVMKKPYEVIFSEFQGKQSHPEHIQGSGDVKYHMGASSDQDFDGKKVHLSLTANPSHLEAVDPVVIGKVRAKQDQRKDQTRSQVMGVLFHGDAAFSGQGIVAETLALSQLEGYETGGTLHIILNNQIGFTTSPRYGRSSSYCSDIALSIQAPIFHVNGDDTEAVIRVMRLASEYRHVFKSDVVIDLVCYRRFGHNESDEPSFTQPLMYKKIAEHPTIRQIYTQRLIQEGTVSKEEALAFEETFDQKLQKDFKEAATYKLEKIDWLEGQWKGLSNKSDKNAATGVTKQVLNSLGTALCQIPNTFHLNSKLARHLKARLEMVTENQPIDWAMGEALAFASLLTEGYPVRLSGQDSLRGTFSQRHAALVDQETEERYIPLNHLVPNQAHFEGCESPLSEAAVLGFEVGYSFAEPRALVMWEAQFGDFANGAQTIIDQFIVPSETKWLRLSGLVMLLPHGYEGQGPEHSSARLERYLQLCGDENLQVTNCTTPANFFHVLRRQLHRTTRKPLIVMTPKSLLRHKLAVSHLKDFETGSHFQEVIPDFLKPSTSVRRVILCSGKVYYDLLEKREEEKIKDIAIIRLEQFYPFPHETLVKFLKPYANADLVWCQEEPQNMGAWTFLDRRLESVLRSAKMKGEQAIYAGRPESASTATGFGSRHAYEQDLLISQALNLKAK